MESNSVRLIVFISTFLVLAILEIFFSYRNRNLLRKDRWVGNIGLIFISNLVIKITLPLGLTYFAISFQDKGWGLFNIVNLNNYLELILSIILLDAAIYLQHILSHKIPIIWKLHRVHHADTDLDVTSALRFHPIEIILSIGYKLGLLILLGVGPEAIIVFEVILSSMAMFNHSNLYLPASFERVLRFFIVTPQMHIIHHSVNRKESDMNYGFNLSVWDRLFGTYQKEFSTDDKIGQSYYRDKKEHTLSKILLLPFVAIEKKAKS